MTRTERQEIQQILVSKVNRLFEKSWDRNPPDPKPSPKLDELAKKEGFILDVSRDNPTRIADRALYEQKRRQYQDLIDDIKIATFDNSAEITELITAFTARAEQLAKEWAK